MTTEQKTITLEIVANMARKNEMIDCITVMRRFQQLTGAHLDHHEFAYYLDYLRSIKLLKITKYGEFEQYGLNN